jgi:hypothetical protein
MQRMGILPQTTPSSGRDPIVHPVAVKGNHGVTLLLCPPAPPPHR